VTRSQLAILYIINNEIKIGGANIYDQIRQNSEIIATFAAISILTSKYLWVKY